MTTHDKDKVIAAANEVGFYEGTDFDGSKFNSMPEACWAKFYAIAFEDGRQAEREECAKVAISYDSSPWAHDQSALHVADIVAAAISKQIRARDTK